MRQSGAVRGASKRGWLAVMHERERERVSE